MLVSSQLVNSIPDICNFIWILFYFFSTPHLQRISNCWVLLSICYISLQNWVHLDDELNISYIRIIFNILLISFGVKHVMGHILKLFRRFAQIRHLNNFKNLSFWYWLLFVIILSQFLIKLVYFTEVKGENEDTVSMKASAPRYIQGGGHLRHVLARSWKGRARPDGSSQKNSMLWDMSEVVGGQYFPLCIAMVLVNDENCFATLPIFQSSLTQISKRVKNLRTFKMILQNLQFLAFWWSEGIWLLLSSWALDRQCILASVSRPYVSLISDARGGSAAAEVCHPTGVGRMRIGTRPALVVC